MNPPNTELLIKHLRGLKYDPNATRAYELLSGGFIWSDERPDGTSQGYSDNEGGYALRFLFGYRASLTRGKPDEKIKSIWDAVQTACPDWPGFRPERFSTDLAQELESEGHRAMRRFDALDRLYERKAKKRREEERSKTMPPLFPPNIQTKGRLLRAAFAIAFFIASLFAYRLFLWLAIPLAAAGAFTLFESLRGWCALRACGIKTRL